MKDTSLHNELTQDGHETAIPQLTTLKFFWSRLPQTSLRDIVQSNCTLKEIATESTDFGLGYGGDNWAQLMCDNRSSKIESFDYTGSGMVPNEIWEAINRLKDFGVIKKFYL